MIRAPPATRGFHAGDQVSFSLGCSHAGRCDTFVRGTQLSCGTRCRPLMPGWLHGGRLSWDGDSVVARLAALMPPCPLVCSTMHKVQPDLPHCNRNLHTCPLLSSRQFSCYRVYRGLHRLCLLVSSFNYPISFRKQKPSTNCANILVSPVH